MPAVETAGVLPFKFQLLSIELQFRFEYHLLAGKQMQKLGSMNSPTSG